MSAFIVSDDCMNRCVHALIAHAEQSGGGWYGPLAETFGVSDADTSLGTAIGRKLYALNVRAVQQRYSERPPANLPGNPNAPGPFRYRPRRGRVNREGGFKALDCLLYQCSEGDAPEHPDFKTLERLHLEIGLDVVRSSRAYIAADWD